MKKNSFLIIAIATLTTFSSCFLNPDCKTGSGEIKSISRETAYFESIEIKGSCDIIINHGDSIKVTIKDYNNLIDLVETKVENKKLSISYKNDACVSNSKLEVAITMPHLKKVAIKGSGSVNASGNFSESSIHAEISGSGDIVFNLTDTTGLFKAEINGSGTIEASRSVCDSASAEINGSGDINVNSMKYLKASISGSGTITYKGSPKTETKISGSGEVINK